MDYTYTTTSYSTTTMDPAAAAAVVLTSTLVALVFVVFAIVCMWRIFSKAGKPGWAAIIPIYNTIVELQIIGRPIWWILVMMFVPFLNVWTGIIVMLDLAKSFNRSVGFAILLILLPIIGLPILAFGKNSKYVGPVGQGKGTFMPAEDQPVAPVSAMPVSQPASTSAPVEPAMPPTDADGTSQQQ